MPTENPRTSDILRNLDAAEQLLGEVFCLFDSRHRMRGNELRQQLANVLSCIAAAKGYATDGSAPFGDDISAAILRGMRGEVA